MFLRNPLSFIVRIRLQTVKVIDDVTRMRWGEEWLEPADGGEDAYEYIAALISCSDDESRNRVVVGGDH